MKHSYASVPDASLLDNPIWHALSTEQAYLAQGNRLAKRFPRDVAPFGALVDQSAASYEALHKVFPEEAAALFLDAEPQPPPGWAILRTGLMYQMVCDTPTPGNAKQELRELTKADVPEMLALTKLTEPGPFLPRTIELGAYFGIHDAGSLVAMAGERLHLTGFTEVSAVCTHPEFRGRGYGHALLSVLISRIVKRGETPVLHVWAKNAPAVRLYEKMGFKVRARLHLAVVKYGPASVEAAHHAGETQVPQASPVPSYNRE
jgi:ribosomal protein S18 acetylase RimI-like enzyme